MKTLRKIIALLMILALTFTSVFAATEKNSAQGTSGRNVNQTNRFIIKYKNSTSKSLNFNSESNGLENKLKSITKEVRKMKNSNLSLLETNEAMTEEAVLSKIQEAGLLNSIEYVQADEIVTLLSNDTYFSEQWGLSNNTTVTDSVYGISVNVDVGAVPAWNISQGKEIIVAVIDTGIDISHEDLAANIWVNSNEIPNDGIDNDDNGYMDDVNGWNFIENNNVVYDSNNTNSEQHGTAIAGIIAAEKDNGKGIAGVAPKVKVMPLKVFNNGQAYTSDILNAIEYAKSMGVKVVNCSWGSHNDNPALKEAIEGSGMLFICAAGNNSNNIAESPIYPAAFNSENIISVGSIDKDGSQSDFSNYGTNVDVFAPGKEIISTLPGNQYNKLSGTSMAAGFVSGEAALLMSKYQESSISEIKGRVTGYTDKLNEINKINCAKAISTSGDGIIPVSGSAGSTTVAGAVYDDKLGFSLLSLQDGYSTPADVTAPVFPLPSNTVNGQMKVSVFGNTITNTLNDKGDFEIDDNNDGRADAWAFSYSTANGLVSDSVTGKHAQRVKANVTKGESYFYTYSINNSPAEKAGAYYIVSGYIKVLNNENLSQTGITITPSGSDTFHEN